MVLFSIGKNRAVKIAAVSVFAVFMIALCFIIAFESKPSVPDFATADGVGKYSTRAEDTKTQIKFLSRFGIRVDKNTKRTDTVRIPANFDEVYEDYNGIQKEAGLDLKPFRGELVSRVKYKLRQKERYVTLLIFRGYVIGGHLGTGEYGDGYEGLNGEIG